jgi:hypothetical protein
MLEICAKVLRSRESLIAIERSPFELTLSARQFALLEARLSYQHRPPEWPHQHTAQQAQQQPVFGWGPAPHR